MKNSKIKLFIILAMCEVFFICPAYSDYPGLDITNISPGNFYISKPVKAYDPSEAFRERENENNRLNQSLQATSASNNQCPPISYERIQPYRSSNTNDYKVDTKGKNYVQSKPLSLKGIYRYDAYGN